MNMMPASMPRPEANDPPTAKRRPERRSPLTALSPNSTVVPSLPRVPAIVRSVPVGLVVTSGGRPAGRIQTARYSALAQNRPLASAHMPQSDQHGAAQPWSSPITGDAWGLTTAGGAGLATGDGAGLA